MKKLTLCALMCLFPLLASAAPPWQEVTVPSVAEAAQSFASPPRQFGAIHWAVWGGQQTKERILADITNINANGGCVYMINNSQRVMPKYLSPEYLDIVKFVVDECKKRGMYVWIEGDCGYPDGFAGGLITQDYPQLGQQGIVADAHCIIAGGKSVSFPLPSDTLGIYASQAAAAAPAAEAGQAIQIPADGKLNWYGASGSSYEVTVTDANGVAIRYSVVAGQTLHIQVPPNTRSIESTTRAAGPRGGGGPAGGAAGARGGAGGGAAGGQPTIIPDPADGQFKWTAPAGGDWDITFVRHLYRSSPTRNDAGENGGATKDSRYTEIDYLDPAATAVYLKCVHEAYEKVVGDEFGKTILGWRFDETDYTGFSPWTPKLLETFKQQKGYDLQPYIAEMFASPQSPESQRVKADYWDVWSGMFRDNFYKPLQDWCRARNMDYMGHLNHEETQINPRGESMVSNEGSFWRDLRYIGVPGIDNLSQIGPGIVADFPKIAASAAHINGHPLVWEEEGGDTSPNGKFIYDYQLVRGVNYLNIRGLNAAPSRNGLLDRASAMGWYVTRSQHLMAIGRPAAQVALFHPTDSYWLGDTEADTVTIRLQTQLIRHQIDFDHVDSDALGSYFTLDSDGFKNLSGQVYKAVVIPTSTVIQKSVLDRLRTFAGNGGKVVFVGRTPTMVVDKTFLNPVPGAPDLSFATIEPSGEITDRVVAALPKPDVKLDTPSDMINYIHRSLKDGEVYMFFNESRQTLSRTVMLAGTGQVQLWDAGDGTIHPLAGVAKADGTVAVPLTLGSQEAKFIVIGPLPANAAAAATTINAGQTLVALDGDWTVKLGATPLTTGLKSWEALGEGTFTGIADYTKTFDTPAALPQGKRLYLDLGEVNDMAHIKVNGKDFDSRGWPSYVWDVTDAIKTGANTLEVQVQVAEAGGGRGGGGAGGGAAPAGGRGGRAAPGAPPAGNVAPADVPAGVVGAPVGGAAAAGAGRGAGRGAAAGGRGRGTGGGGGGQAAATVERGLIGPVRLIAQ